jgi:hypothetical protein
MQMLRRIVTLEMQDGDEGGDGDKRRYGRRQ